ncbi:unnamed protein product [Tilletia controversa]|uniref:(2E,6E)-farnesyl diphosphate synthase n=3 Tax=Tilletia TaxID=13289 RepID=A0A8X7MLM2_9BASI|nr:hypothetical protein CF328_g6815 [Tilletia controversa]KAE8197399.1 hypothetical protein CF336_g2180 [Tilletia laevis]KAE8250022.1 hypothetical protein A4X03_0g6528 [Tilletia caries]KAE8241237.1 hypothetical protein A4X06_0g7612 [Tilletia controversa]CAD6893412.1 unnamed protein product [Tilletia caries]
MARSFSTQSANFSTSSTYPGGDPAWYDHALDRLAQQPAWPQDKERAIMEPYDYLSAHPGKEVRTRLIEAFNVWLQVPAHKLEAIGRIVSMLHTASLLMDDVEDNSDLRRGIPVAHKIYGVPQTINTANYVYFKVLSDIFALTTTRAGGLDESHARPTSEVQTNEPPAPPRLSPVTSGTATPTDREQGGGAGGGGSDPSHSRTPSSSLPFLSMFGSRRSVENLVVEEMINLHRGQGMDLFWRDSLICPTEEEYVEMVNNKTGGLFRIALKLMMTQSPVLAARKVAGGGSSRREQPHRGADAGTNDDESALPDLIPLANVIGLLFQIRDDYMNLQSSQYASNKGFCEDLTEGKFSFPIIHSIRASAGIASTSSSTDSAPSPNRQILNVLKQRPTDEATKSYAVAYMRDQTHSFAYTRNVLRRLDEQARREVERIAGEWRSTRGVDVVPTATGSTTNAKLVGILDALRGGWWEESQEDRDAAR